MRRASIIAILAIFCLSLGCPKKAEVAVSVDIPFEEFTLPNGLRVIVHVDRKAPIVAVNIWYHVGSKDEPKGKSGFAHLFEHLMFNGSENHTGEYFAPLTQVGVTDINGTTNFDRTNYFQNVPTTALETALFMESDRMGHLLGAISQETLDEQRGVVQNEKRQGENRPYGRSYERILKAVYPEGHPYNHTTIGSMNDLNAATLGDVKEWFSSWYGPNNAVLVIAGDIDLATAKKQVTRYFGDIPASVSLAKKAPMVSKRSKDTRETMTDQVAQTVVMQVWNVPEFGSKELVELSLLADVLGGLSASRLDRRLVHQDKLVDSISASVNINEISSLFMIRAAIKEGVQVENVEKAIQEEVDRLLKDGLTKEELEQAKTKRYASFVRGIERIGGFGGKADVLAMCAVYDGNPGCFREQLNQVKSAGGEAIIATGKKWLTNGKHTLAMVPGEVKVVEEAPSPVDVFAKKDLVVDKKFKTVTSDVNRKNGVPFPKTFPELRFPKLQRAQLANGIKIILAERHEVPVIQLKMSFPGGFSSDQGRRPGTASFAVQMMQEGAGSYDALALASRKDILGANLSARAELDFSTVSLSALKERLADSISLFADVILRPRFEDKEIERVRSQWLAAIKQEKTSPAGIINRVIRPLVFGIKHPYGIPGSGTGYEKDISTIKREELLSWLKENIRPQNAVVTVVGDTTMKEMVGILTQYFADFNVEGKWSAQADIANMSLPKAPRVFLVDKPGAVQSNISASLLIPSSKNKDAFTFDLSNEVIGGDFSARLNMNLREAKRWSYGAYSRAPNSLGQRLWSVAAPVQSDKTKESIQEIQREISDYAAGKVPVKKEELERIKAKNTRMLPGAFETSESVLEALSNIHIYGYADDYLAKRKAEVEALTTEKLESAAKWIRPESLTWVIVGDLKSIEKDIRELNLGEVKIVDADGQEIFQASE